MEEIESGGEGGRVVRERGKRERGLVGEDERLRLCDGEAKAREECEDKILWAVDMSVEPLPSQRSARTRLELGAVRLDAVADLVHQLERRTRLPTAEGVVRSLRQRRQSWNNDRCNDCVDDLGRFVRLVFVEVVRVRFGGLMPVGRERFVPLVCRKVRRCPRKLLDLYVKGSFASALSPCGPRSWRATVVPALTSNGFQPAISTLAQNSHTWPRLSPANIIAYSSFHVARHSSKRCKMPRDGSRNEGALTSLNSEVSDS